MLDSMIAFSLRNRLAVVAMAAALLVYGFFVIRRLPVDVLPDLNRPTVTIQIEAPGLSPEEVEKQVVYPIEASVTGATGVERVRSASAVGLGLVFVEFGWNTDNLVNRQIVSEKLQGLRETLPAGVMPQLGPVTSIMGEIMLISVRADGKSAMSPMDLRTWSDYTLKPILQAIPGIAQVIAMGGERKEWQVRVRPDLLNQFGITLDEVEKAVSAADGAAMGGWIQQGYTEAIVRNFGRLTDSSQLAKAVVSARKGQTVTVGDVADLVSSGAALKRGDAGSNGQPSVILSLKKQPGASTIALTQKVDEILERMQPSLPHGLAVNAHLFRQADFIARSIGNIEDALRDGSLLVIAVLFLFLLNLRTTFITLTAIPLSLVITALVFQIMGLGINTMTLGGLAIAIGELVDDAIVDVENVFRRLRENRLKEKPASTLSVVYHASSEVRNSIVFATVLVVLVFLPLFAMGGIEGKIFVPLGVAYIVSILASLAVSLTVTPALCALLLKPRQDKPHAQDGILVRGLKSIHSRFLLRPAMNRPKTALFLALLLFIPAVFSLFHMGSEFLPPFNEGTATINILSPPGTALAESNRIGTIAEKLILQVPEVISTGRRTGRAEEDDHAEGVHSSEIDVDLKPSARKREEILADMRGRLETLPGVSVSLGQPISHRIDHLLSGVRAQIAVKIFGPDLDTLRDLAEQVQGVMQSVPGVVDLSVEKQVLVPQIGIEPDREALARYGLNAADVAERVRVALAGEKLGEIFEGQRRVDVKVILDEKSRQDIEAIRQLPVDLPSGSTLPLGLIAKVEDGLGPNQILRENAQRRIVVQSNAGGRDLGSVVEDIQAKVSREIPMPPGYTLIYGGQFENQRQASRALALLGLLSLLGMITVLTMHFRSGLLAALILLNIPFSMIGAVAALWMGEGVLSVGTLVGFITLCGIASRNGIMLVAHYLHLLKHEGETWSDQFIERGAQERLVPVLMTALTAGLALLPVVFSPGKPGQEILHPVAVVIFGGLVTSTFMNMALMPTLLQRFGKGALLRSSSLQQENLIAPSQGEKHEIT